MLSALVQFQTLTYSDHIYICVSQHVLIKLTEELPGIKALSSPELCFENYLQRTNQDKESCLDSQGLKKAKMRIRKLAGCGIRTREQRNAFPLTHGSQQLTQPGAECYSVGYILISVRFSHSVMRWLNPTREESKFDRSRLARFQSLCLSLYVIYFTARNPTS